MATQIIHQDNRSAALLPAPTPEAPSSLMTVIERLASNPNVDIDKLRQLLEMQEKWEMTRAKADFRDAMAQFKKNPPEIIKSRTAKLEGTAKGSGNSYSFEVKYADLENVTSAIIDGLAEVGIVHSFKIRQEGQNITVACFLSRGIYEESVSLTAGPDSSGAKNAIQQVASTVSYLERYTLLAATGLAAGMPDNDGNLQGAGLDPDAIKARVATIQQAADVDALKKAYEAAVRLANEAKDKKALNAFAETKNRRYKELAKVVAHA